MEKRFTRKVLSKTPKNDVVKELAEFLQNNPHAKILLANKLDYTTSNTIDMWLYRESIPTYQVHRVLRFIRRYSDVATQ